MSDLFLVFAPAAPEWDELAADLARGSNFGVEHDAGHVESSVGDGSVRIEEFRPADLEVAGFFDDWPPDRLPLRRDVLTASSIGRTGFSLLLPVVAQLARFKRFLVHTDWDEVYEADAFVRRCQEDPQWYWHNEPQRPRRVYPGSFRLMHELYVLFQPPVPTKSDLLTALSEDLDPRPSLADDGRIEVRQGAEVALFGEPEDWSLSYGPDWWNATVHYTDPAPAKSVVLSLARWFEPMIHTPYWGTFTAEQFRTAATADPTWTWETTRLRKGSSARRMYVTDERR